ncbi:hypothetical protein EGI31_19820 [Lacihabitans soyangensis]|uniref:Uncharacterized protein n=1 Tax=Lacihabitans soyangensis TaxID=869394 RepID=A0AAE3KUQ5_9BACT|nr:hypothetical protein [Lacihabitans soyangensis]
MNYKFSSFFFKLTTNGPKYHNIFKLKLLDAGGEGFIQLLIFIYLPKALQNHYFLERTHVNRPKKTT